MSLQTDLGKHQPGASGSESLNVRDDSERKKQRTIKGTKSNTSWESGRVSRPEQAEQTLKLQQKKVDGG